MDLKEIVIIFINAASMALGYSTIIYSVYNLFVRQKISFYKLFLLMYFVAVIISFVAISYVSIGLGVISLIYLYILQKKRLFSLLSCLLSTAIFLLMMAANNIILAFIVKIPENNALELRHTLFYNIYNSIIFLAFSLAAFIIINIISKYSNRLKVEFNEDRILSDCKVVVFVIITAVIFTVIISTAWFIGLIYPENARQYMAFSGIVSFLMILFAIYAVYSIINAVSYKEYEIKIEKDKEITELYRNEVQNMYNNIREFKHDYMKIYSSMSILIEQNRMDELKKYFYNEIMPFQNEIMNETDIVQEITLFDDVIIQGLIYSYIIKSRNNDINFIISISENIPSISNKIDNLDIVRVLGILLDNAFEEVEKIKGNIERIVEFAAVIGSELVFIVRNKYDVKPNMSEIFIKDYSTKGTNHGIGLTAARDIMKKYDDVYMRVRLEDNQFIAEVHAVI